MLFSFLLIPSHRAYADDVKITIEGKVVDIKENPLQGVAVIVKGTNIGVETDAEGRYILSFATSTGEVGLIYSYIGYKTVEKTFKTSQVMNITMDEDVTFISTVVVTGFANIKQESFTGNSVTS